MDLGKYAEKFILNYLANRDKNTYVARFVDTYDANKGRWGDSTQKKVIVEERPCDAMLIYDGITYFCEVKSTESKIGVSPSLFKKKGQKAARLRITNAGGSYLYLIYSYALEQWYWVTYLDLNENANWFELENFKIDFPKVPR